MALTIQVAKKSHKLFANKPVGREEAINKLGGKK